MNSFLYMRSELITLCLSIIEILYEAVFQDHRQIIFNWMGNYFEGESLSTEETKKRTRRSSCATQIPPSIKLQFTYKCEMCMANGLINLDCKRQNIIEKKYETKSLLERFIVRDTNVVSNNIPPKPIGYPR